MRHTQTSAYEIAQRFIGIREIPGSEHNPQILAMLGLHNDWPEDDETPWCSAFAAYPFWLLGLEHSKSLRARSWLEHGETIGLNDAEPGFDVVILSRGPRPQPGPGVIEAAGHVGLLSRYDSEKVFLLGGNQGDAVTIEPFPISRILGVRRIA